MRRGRRRGGEDRKKEQREGRGVGRGGGGRGGEDRKKNSKRVEGGGVGGGGEDRKKKRERETKRSIMQALSYQISCSDVFGYCNSDFVILSEPVC